MPVKKNIYMLVFLISYLILIQPSYSMNNEFVKNNNHIVSSCTIFTAAIGDTVYFGNNEDYLLENAYQWYMPSQNVTTSQGKKEIYGTVFFGFDNNDALVDSWEQGGMNEYGLCFDANGLPSVNLDLNSSAELPYTANALAQVLWECKNIEEVIEWYQNHRWHVMSGQIHYADRTGDAVVVSANATGQWAFTRINSTFLVSTNFNLNNTENGDYPCNRYNTATQMLESITSEEALTIDACAEILYAVHQEGTYATKYSNILDPVNLDIYFNRGKDFRKSIKFNLKEMLIVDETFERKKNFLGVLFFQNDILVKTVKIDTKSTLRTVSIGVIIGPILTSIVLLTLGLYVFRNLRKRTNQEP